MTLEENKKLVLDPYEALFSNLCEVLQVGHTDHDSAAPLASHGRASLDRIVILSSLRSGTQ